jgi:hypothetical protein
MRVNQVAELVVASSDEEDTSTDNQPTPSAAGLALFNRLAAEQSEGAGAALPPPTSSSSSPHQQHQPHHPTSSSGAPTPPTPPKPTPTLSRDQRVRIELQKSAAIMKRREALAIEEAEGYAAEQAELEATKQAGKRKRGRTETNYTQDTVAGYLLEEAVKPAGSSGASEDAGGAGAVHAGASVANAYGQAPDLTHLFEGGDVPNCKDCGKPCVGQCSVAPTSAKRKGVCVCVGGGGGGSRYQG